MCDAWETANFSWTSCEREIQEEGEGGREGRKSMPTKVIAFHLEKNKADIAVPRGKKIKIENEI